MKKKWFYFYLTDHISTFWLKYKIYAGDIIRFFSKQVLTRPDISHPPMALDTHLLRKIRHAF